MTDSSSEVGPRLVCEKRKKWVVSIVVNTNLEIVRKKKGEFLALVKRPAFA